MSKDDSGFQEFSSGSRHSPEIPRFERRVWCKMTQTQVDMNDCDGKYEGISCIHYDACRKEAGLPELSNQELFKPVPSDKVLSKIEEPKEEKNKEGWKWEVAGTEEKIEKKKSEKKETVTATVDEKGWRWS